MSLWQCRWPKVWKIPASAARAAPKIKHGFFFLFLLKLPNSQKRHLALLKAYPFDFVHMGLVCDSLV
jgi:hypothetical protein